MNETCSVTNSDNQRESENRHAEDREAQIRARFPLADFEAEAWINFQDPAYGAIDELFADHPDATAQALIRYCGLTRGYYTVNDIQINRDQRKVTGWIEQWIEWEQERLQDECVDLELRP